MRDKYVHGSTVPQFNSEKERKEYYSIVNTKKVKGKSVQWNPLYVIITIIVIGVLAIVPMESIKLNSEVTRLRSQKGELKSRYEKMVQDNNLYYDSIISKVDLAEIERIAVVELGMSMAREGQIIEYSGEIDDYVKQYETLPGL